MKYKNLGFGLGLRPDHFQDILGEGVPPPGQNHLSPQNPVDWFEVLSENYMGIKSHGQSPQLTSLLKVRESYPIVFHCVSTNIGSVDPVDKNFLLELKELVNLVQPEWVSDHLCWVGVHGRSSHELLPLPYNPESVDVVSANIHKVQETLNQRFMIENTSSYMSFEHSEMTEWEFITEIIKKTDCGLLLDVNNVYVSSQNHDFDPKEFIDNIPLENVGQLHLAGHRIEDNGLIVDTHDNSICDEVFELLSYTVSALSKKATPTTPYTTFEVSSMVEWDSNIPSYEDYVGELLKVKTTVETTLRNANET